MVVAFILLGGGVFALEKTNPREPANPTVYVVEVKDTDVQRLDVQTPSGTAAFERADPLGWKFANSGAEADLSRVSSVVNRLAKLRSSSKVTDNPTNLAQYGLDPPTEVAILTMKDGSTTRILIGSKTANDAAYFAMADGKNQLHTINTLLVGDFEKLVTQPPVPSPTPEATPSPTPRGGAATPTPEPESGAEVVGTPTPTVGLPAPSLGAP
jgi:hypothetical protein